MKVFGSVINILIPKKKRHKSDIYKNWKRIFIGYNSNITKHLYAWAPKTQQILLVTNLYVNESEERAKLLIKHPFNLTYKTLAKHKSTSKLRLCGRPWKIIAVEKTPTIQEPELQEVAENINTGSVPQKETAKSADLGNIENSNKNQKDVASVKVEKAISAMETSSKIHKPETYKKAISDPVHSWRWKTVIEEKIQNLENYYTWKYNQLQPRRKAVRFKWIFKVKYYPDRLVAQYKARLIAQGFSQIYGIDFNKIFSPIMWRESLHIFLAIFCLLELSVD